MAPLLGALQLPTDTERNGTQVGEYHSPNLPTSLTETEDGTVGQYFGVKIVMNEDRAKRVLRWRTQDHYTWREIAQHWSEFYGPDHGGNQLYGMDICDAAAEQLGGNMWDELWNGDLDEDS